MSSYQLSCETLAAQSKMLCTQALRHSSPLFSLLNVDNRSFTSHKTFHRYFRVHYQQNMSYLALPAEIRQQILRHALVLDLIAVSPNPSPEQEPWDRKWLKTIHSKIVDYMDCREHWEPHTSATLNQVEQPAKDRIKVENLEVTAIVLLGIKDNRDVLKLHGAYPLKLLTGDPLLACCRQTYNEGHQIFFAENTFQLPPGPIKHSIAWLSGLQPANAVAITSLAISLSSWDLSSEILEHLSHLAFYEKIIRRETWHENNWARPIREYLIEIWTKKIAFLKAWGQIVQIHHCDRCASRLRTPDDDPHHDRDASNVKLCDTFGDFERIVSSIATHVSRQLKPLQLPYTWRTMKGDTFRIVARKRPVEQSGTSS